MANLVTNHCVKYYAIPSINACVTEKHVVEDDILFTKPLAGKGLICSVIFHIRFNIHADKTKSPPISQWSKSPPMVTSPSISKLAGVSLCNLQNLKSLSGPSARLINIIQIILQDTFQTEQAPNIEVCVYLHTYICDLVHTALVADPPLITIEALMTLFYPLIESNHRVSCVLWAGVRLEGPGKETV